MTLADARARLRKATDRVERELQGVGIRWEGPGPADITDADLKRAKETIDRVKKMPGEMKGTLRKWVVKMGDALFDIADKTSGAVAKGAKDLAWKAWTLAAGPLLILGGIWLLTQLD